MNNIQKISSALTLIGHSDWVHSVTLFPDNLHAVSGSFDGTVRIWDLRSGKAESIFDQKGKVLSVALSITGKHVASAGENGLFIWDIKTKRRLFELKGHTGMITYVIFSPNGKFLASCSIDKSLRIWNADTYEPIGTGIQGHEESLLSLAFSPDSKFIYSTSSDHTVRKWSIPNGKLIAIWKGHTNTVRWISIAKDGKRAATASYDGTVGIWNTESGKQLFNWRPGGDVVTVAEYLHDGRILTASRNLDFFLWSPPYSHPSIIFSGHINVVEALTISRDEKSLITASWDKSLMVWKIPQSGN